MTAPRYPILAARTRSELIVDRSRFLATLAPVETVEAAQEVVAGVRAELPDATHHCWAWVVGPPGSTAYVGLSDAGEPHGTAGRPMLDTLLGSDVGDVVAVVSRWFGGVKLGKGGLVRAYSGAVARALAEAQRAERVEWCTGVVHVAYPHVDAVRRLYPSLEVVVEEETFGADVVHRLRVPAERLDALKRALADATAGQARLEPEGPRE